MKSLIVSSMDDFKDTGEFQPGQELTRGPAIAAYLRLCLNEYNQEETTLSSAEILDTYNKVSKDYEGDDLEVAVLDALCDRESGKDNDDDATISVEVATARQATAFTIGGKLNGKFNADLIAILDAGDTIKRGPVVLMDDIRERWSKAEIMEFPRMGSKMAKADKDKIELSNVIYDFYRTNIGSEKISSSWCEDIIRATKEGQRIVNLIEALHVQGSEAGDKSLGKTQADEQIKLERTRLKNAANALRKGITLSLVLWRLEDNCPKLEIEVQRDNDGIPLRTQYPVIIEQRGLKSSRKAMTLSQVLSLYKQDAVVSDGKTLILDGVDKAIIGGGTMDALNKALPKKAPKRAASLKVSNVAAAYDVIFALNTFFENGGAGAYGKSLTGPKREAYVMQIGDLFSQISPLYHGEVADEYVAMNTRKTPAQRKAG